MGCISHDANVTIEYRYLMELKKVKGHDERRLAEENFDHMAGRVNRASPLYQLEIPFEDHYGERERPSFDHSARLQDCFRRLSQYPRSVYIPYSVSILLKTTQSKILKRVSKN